MDIDLVGVEDFMQDKFCLLPVAKIYFDEKITFLHLINLTQKKC